MCTQHTNADDDDDTVVFGKEGNNGEKASLDVVGTLANQVMCEAIKRSVSV